MRLRERNECREVSASSSTALSLARCVASVGSSVKKCLSVETVRNFLSFWKLEIL